MKDKGEGAEVVDWHSAAYINRFICDIANRDAKRYVVHLHGRSAAPEHVVLTVSSYVDRYLATDDTRLKLLAVFMTHPVVFVGYSMNDPDLMQLLREVTARVRMSSPRHFAIVGAESDEEREATARRMLGKFGVRAVFYRTIKQEDQSIEHSGLLRLLERLAASTGVAAISRSKAISFPETTATDIYDSDPNKGRFGGSYVANRRALRLESFEEIEKRQWLALTIVVESEAGPRLEGSVILHLHPSFEEASYDVAVNKRGVARQVIEATGAFTIGAVADGGLTRLELDLAKVAKLPAWFRER